MRDYKTRFEAGIDMDTFLQLTSKAVEVITSTHLGIGVGTELVFKSSLPLDGLLAILQCVPDGHVAMRELELLELGYEGELELTDLGHEGYPK